MRRNLLLFGPPGVGKGTQALRLAGEIGVPHVAPGNMFREAVKSGSALGQRVAGFMSFGELVPDDVVIQMIIERIARPDALAGFILDGFPRTVVQAEALELALRTAGRSVDLVLSLEAPTETLVARMAGRRACGVCQASYHLTNLPPRMPDTCDRCGGPLVQRPDDTEEAVRRRLAEYGAKTSPVMGFFAQRAWPVTRIDASGDVDSVFRSIRAAVR